MAYNPNTSTMYTRDFDTLFTVDVSDASTTLIGPSGTFITSLAFSTDFLTLFSFDQSNGNFYHVNPANGHTYVAGQSFEQIIDIDTARAIAALAGGYVVAVNDAEEQQWIVDTFNSSYAPFWLGLSDEIVEGEFLWDSGEPLTYTNWASGQPDDGRSGEDFVRLTDTWEWEDVGDGAIAASFLETEKPSGRP